MGTATTSMSMLLLAAPGAPAWIEVDDYFYGSIQLPNPLPCGLDGDCESILPYDTGENSNQQPVGAFDCISHPFPMQSVLNEQTGNYELKELSLQTGFYTSLYEFGDPPNLAEQADTMWYRINAVSFNIANQIAYGKFSDSTNTDYLCRFSATPSAQPMQCVCTLQPAGSGGNVDGGLIAGAIHSDTYYVSKGGRNIFAVPSVSALTTDGASNACPGQWVFGSSATSLDGLTGDPFDISGLGLNLQSLIDQYGWDETAYSTSTASNYFRSHKYNADSDLVYEWSPTIVGYADVISLDMGGESYLVWLGSATADLLLIKLGGGPMQIAGHAFVRTRIDWDGASPVVEGSPGFSASHAVPLKWQTHHASAENCCS